MFLYVCVCARGVFVWVCPRHINLSIHYLHCFYLTVHTPLTCSLSISPSPSLSLSLSLSLCLSLLPYQLPYLFSFLKSWMITNCTLVLICVTVPSPNFLTCLWPSSN